MVFQVPIPEPLRWLEPSETETRTMHALAEYGAMHVKLYEDIARHGRIATTYDYPVMVNQRYMMRPSPIPKLIVLPKPRGADSPPWPPQSTSGRGSLSLRVPVNVPLGLDPHGPG